MKKQIVLAAVVAWLAPAVLALALDAVKKNDGTTVSCQVVKVGKVNVEVEEKSVPKEIPTNEIDHILYEGESTTVKQVRVAVLSGRYNDAVEQIGKIQEGDLSRKEVQQDIDFYKAYSVAQLALAGEGEVADAGRQMLDFTKNHPESYHYFRALETVGDLLVANRKYDTAATFYARLGDEAPWADYKMRSGVAVGRSLLAQNKPQDALAVFEKVLATDAQGDLADQQKQAATLGKARCLAETGKGAEAVQMIQDVIAKADAEDTDLLAQAYNALGTALKKGGDAKGALLAFLHVDVLYFGAPAAHAEALANLAELWNTVHQTERAVEARQILQERYKNSPWAQ